MEPEKNIDRVASALSSNDAENIVSVLSKYLHSKIIWYGKTDTWKIYQLFVAGARSDDKFEDKI